jgi:hypothetical protein
MKRNKSYTESAMPDPNSTQMTQIEQIFTDSFPEVLDEEKFSQSYAECFAELRRVNKTPLRDSVSNSANLCEKIKKRRRTRINDLRIKKK